MFGAESFHNYAIRGTADKFPFYIKFFHITHSLSENRRPKMCSLFPFITNFIKHFHEFSVRHSNILEV
jgi:hypothetical protein